MHISEGILSGPVLASGAALAVAGTMVGLKKLDYDNIARAGMLSSAFFVASFIHVPLGPANVHLVLNGLVGILLGWGAFPVILVALILQAVLFQYGGISALGVNMIIMALPPVFCYYLFRFFAMKKKQWLFPVSFTCGFLSVLFSSILMGMSLLFTEKNFFVLSSIIIGAYFPVMIIEGFVTAFCVTFLKKVKPEIFMTVG